MAVLKANQRPADPIDPNLKLPDAVKVASAKADEIHANNYTKPVDTPTEPASTEPASTEPASTEPAPPTPVPSEPAPPVPPVSEDTWEHKYKSLKGRYDRQASALAELNEQVRNLRDIIATMKSNPPPAAPQPVEDLITPEEVKEYGTEFIDVVSRAARQVAAPLERRIAELQAQLSNVGANVQTDARARMLAELDNKLENWREINVDPEFISWLQLPDAYSGAIRHELLKAAFDQNQTARVLAFFNGFLAEEAAVAPADPALATSPPPVTSGGNPPAPKVKLEDLAAPGRARSAPGTPPPAEKPFITRAQIAQFYTDVAAEKYRGRDEERKRLEAMIFEAQRDGRIR